MFLCTTENGTHKNHSDKIWKHEGPVEPSTSDASLSSESTSKDETPQATTTAEATLAKPASSSTEAITYVPSEDTKVRKEVVVKIVEFNK